MNYSKYRKSTTGNKLDWENLRKIDKNLLESLELKDFENVDKLIQNGANINVRFGEIKDSALHFFDDIDIVQKLVNCGASVSASNRYYETPLIYACRFGRNHDVINCLLSNGAYVNKQIYFGRERMIPLTLALENMKDKIDINIIENLLYYGANVDFGKMFTNTPFITALKSSTEMARSMIKYSVLKIWDKYRYLRMGCVERRQLILINNRQLLSYLEECVNEVALLKEEMFSSWHSLYDICRGNLYENLYTEPYSSFVKEYRTDAFKAKYPIYTDVLLKRVDGIRLHRSKLLTDLDNVQIAAKFKSKKDCKRLVKLNSDCVRHIAQYLSNCDIERIIRIGS